ncbi:tetraacyldisaccharide 4'-kinase [Myxococcota bacterium]|nr:tetraacyldisaccharide 4'-kinase [Myxococcota bacterium]
MILRADWLWERRAGPWWRFLLWFFLTPLGWIYGIVSLLHREVYRLGLRRAVCLPAQVISVGNLVVGGTGKTPVAAWLARSLHRRGLQVALASRGYGRVTTGDVVVVSDGEFVRATLDLAGDEPMLLAAHVPGVPVLVAEDRVHAGLRAVTAFGTETLVLDDGFQHHRLHRDLDIVTVDGRLGFGNRHTLPRGPLRELAKTLSRADALGVVDGPLTPDDEAFVQRYAPDLRRFEVRRRPVGFRPLDGGVLEPASSLEGQRVGLLSGLANPASFRATVESLGMMVDVVREFPDHHRYRARDLRDLSGQARFWLTTEKDALKISPSWARGVQMRVLIIEAEVEGEQAFLDWLMARLR